MQEDDEAEIECLLQLGRLMVNQGQIAEAAKFLASAVTSLEQDLGPESPLVGMLLLDLFDFYELLGDDVSAGRTFEKIRRILVVGAGSSQKPGADYRRQRVMNLSGNQIKKTRL